MIPHQMGLIVRRAALARIGHAAVCGFLWLGLTAASARAGNVSWVIDADGQWTAASNWSSNPALPGPTDDVTIDVPGDRLITLTNSTQSIKSLISAERMVLTFGGTLNLGTTGQFNNTVTLNGGTLSGGTISFGNGGGLVIATNGSNVLSNLTINGDLNVGGGYSVVSGPLTFINGGNASIGSGGALAYLGTALTLSPATYAIDGGTLGVYGQNATQTMTLTTGVTVRGRGNLGNYTNIGGPSLNLVNNGTITADVPGLTLAVAPQNTFTNNTTAQAIGGGILSINAGNWSNAAGGAITATASTLNLNGAWSNAGTITATNSTVNLGGSFTTAGIGTFNRSGGQVNLTGNLDNTGATLNLNAGTGSWTLVAGSLSGGTLTQSGGAGLVIAANGSNRIGNLAINGDLNVGGGYTVVTGPLTFNGGTANVGAGGTLAYQGTSITLPGPATYAIDGGTIGVYGQNATQTLTVGTGVTVRGRGSLGNYTNIGGPSLNLVNNGTITADIAGQTLSVAPQNTFTNNGTAQAIGGATLNIAGNLNNAPGGTITATASTLNLNGAWNNAGTITATNATVNLAGNFTTANIGTINRTGGAVNLTGALDNTGATLNLNAGTGSWTLVGGSLTGGTLTQTGGAGLAIALNGSNRLANLTINGDLNVGGGYTLVSGPLAFNGGSANVGSGTISYQGLSPTVVGPSTYAIGGGTLGIYGLSTSQTLTLASGVTVHGWGNVGNYTNIGGSGNLVNGGTITADTAGQTLAVAPSNSFTNNGTTGANGGTLSITAPIFTNNGILQVSSGTLLLGTNVNFTAAAGSSLLITGGTAQLNHSVSVPQFDLPAGTLSGSGNFSTPAFNWTGGAMSGAGHTTVASGATMTISGTSSKTLS
ncbi:MAG: tandem-95 repeat protein, partial [Phycisphaerales bacterium]|nr:tandem-95 repeat protein [Phycisphaerales bacterium]